MRGGMQRPAQIRAIFAELRAALGQEAHARDLLQLAHLILRAHEAPSAEEDIVVPIGRTPLFALPLDIAMEDGGWRVLNFECEHGIEFDESEPINTNSASRLKILMGLW